MVGPQGGTLAGSGGSASQMGGGGLTDPALHCHVMDGRGADEAYFSPHVLRLFNRCPYGYRRLLAGRGDTCALITDCSIDQCGEHGTCYMDDGTFK